MAGGMRHRPGPTLAERSQRSLGGTQDRKQPADEPTQTDPTATSARRRPVGKRHCWVHDLPDRPGRRFAGLVVEWQPAPGGGWSGRVVYVVDDRQGQPVVVEAWVPADHLHPV